MSHFEGEKLSEGQILLNVLDLCRNTKVLGPGKRYAIWVQGCLRKCPGCGTPEGRSTSINQLLDVTDLAEDILDQTQIEGITISGGEPFLQAKALTELVHLVGARRDLGVIIFTGYYLHELRDLNDRETNDLLDSTDLLIDGPYIEGLNDDIGLRGSDNQSMCFLTDRYLEYKSLLEKGPRQLEVTRTQIIGIKPKHFDKAVEKAFARMLNRKLMASQ